MFSDAVPGKKGSPGCRAGALSLRGAMAPETLLWYRDPLLFWVGSWLQAPLDLGSRWLPYVLRGDRGRQPRMRKGEVGGGTA